MVMLMEQQLTTYRLFRIDSANRIAGVPDIIEAPDDADAIRQAKVISQSRLAEVWQRSRKIAVLDRDEHR